MHPVSGKFFSVSRFTLSDLILMVWEYQILTARMNVDLLTEIFLRHHRAFNMPSRTSFTRGFAFFFRLPEYEIKRIFFLILTGHQQGTSARAEIIQILMG